MIDKDGGSTNYVLYFSVVQCVEIPGQRVTRAGVSTIPHDLSDSLKIIHAKRLFNNMSLK